jgi:hypothetical protein
MCGDYIVTAAGGLYGGRGANTARSQMRLFAPASGRRPFHGLNDGFRGEVVVCWLARDWGYSAIPAAGLIEQNRSAIRQ